MNYLLGIVTMRYNCAQYMTKGIQMKKMLTGLMTVLIALWFGGCTQETQNKFGHGLQNWTGIDGVVDVYSGGKVMIRYIKVDKLTTGKGTDDGKVRPYCYGYGYIDANQNYVVDKGEKKVYFRLSEYSTPYAFYENPEG